jgi:membrane protein DedA with SNARE-associated domain
MLDQVVTFLDNHAWLFLFFGLLLEMAMILHFLPTELVVIGATVSLAHNPVSLVAVILVATAASTIGALVPYGAARFGGRPLLLRFRHVLHLTPERLDRFERVMRGRVGTTAVLYMRITPGLRTAPSIPAGIARMDLRVYVTLTAIGCAVFNGVLALVSYWYGEAFLLWARARMHHFGLWLHEERLALVLSGVLLAWGLYWTCRMVQLRRTNSG